MLKLRDIMTADVVTVSPELSLRDAMDLLGTRHISGAPVVAGGKVVGVVSATDLLSFAGSAAGVPTERPEMIGVEEGETAPEWEEGDEAPSAYFTEMWDDAGADVEERIAHPEGPEWNALDEHTVSEIMTRKVCALRPEMDVRAAADYMRSAGIHRVLVTENRQLLGIVTTMDLTKAVADDRVTTRRYVFDTGRQFDERGWEP